MASLLDVAPLLAWHDLGDLLQQVKKLLQIFCYIRVVMCIIRLSAKKRKM
jgi:hypothetical protein